MENNENVNQPQKKSINDVVNEYKKNSSKNNDSDNIEDKNTAKSTSIPDAGSYNPNNFQSTMEKETDPDLITTHEIVPLPSKGLLYEHKIDKIEVEYMTAKDEDLLTTPSLIENGTVLDILLKRKIKTKGIKVEELLPGDKNAILLFLRTSSYGLEYPVEVSDPRTGTPFKTTADLSKLKYKEISEIPDENGHFNVYIPMRKKNVKFRLLSSGEDIQIFNKAEEIKKAYNREFSEYNTMKLKASIVSIDEKSDRNYIDRFIDAIPARDSLTIRKKMKDVSPDVDMLYPFVAKDGFKFEANLTIGIDFFFPES
jgi:hypothetical protein